MDFKLAPETSKPDRRYRKGSKYDPILESFQNSVYPLVKVEIENRDANYIRTQLKKRLDAKGITNIAVSVVNETCYLEKVEGKKPRKKKGAEPEPEPIPEPTPQ